MCSPMIIFGRGKCSIPRCPLSNMLEGATRAYRHLASGAESVNGTDRQTNKRTDGSIALYPSPTIGLSHDNAVVDIILRFQSDTAHRWVTFGFLLRRCAIGPIRGKVATSTTGWKCMIMQRTEPYTHGRFTDLWTCGFWDMLADGISTERHTWSSRHSAAVPERVNV